MTPRRLVSVLMAWIALVLGACLAVPDEKEPQCRVSADCDEGAGEVCDEGICWGDPPLFPLAAIAGPPGEAKDLVPVEIPSLEIPPHGWMGDLTLSAPVVVRGRVLRACVLPCPEVPVEATISVTRPSSFAGGPGLSFVAKTAVDGTYTLYLPLTRVARGDPPYDVVISPADRGAVRSSVLAAAAAAEEVPPLMQPLTATPELSVTFRMPSIGLPMVSGRVLNGAGAGLAGYRVVARGRWAPNDAEVEVSTVAVTAADGSYQLLLAAGLSGKVVVRAEPPMSAAGAATMEMAEVTSVGVTAGVDLRLPTNERPAVPVTLSISAMDSGGAPLSGDGFSARLVHEIVNGNQTTRYRVEGQIKSGSVTLVAVPGVTGQDFSYKLSMMPPVDSRLTAVFDQALVVGAGGVKPPVRVAERLRVTGVVLDGRGQPFKGVTLTARPSLSFLQELDPTQRTSANELGATTATTSKSGEFVLWADQFVVGLPARYSFTFQPPADELSPTWTTPEIVMPPGGLPSVDLGVIESPEASNVRGQINNHSGRPVAKGRVIIYRLDSTCMLTQGSCSNTATLLGRGVADDNGVVRLSLPKTP